MSEYFALILLWKTEFDGLTYDLLKYYLFEHLYYMIKPIVQIMIIK